MRLAKVLTSDLAQPGQRLRVRHPRLRIGEPRGWQPGEPLRVPAGLPFSVRVRDPSGAGLEDASVSVEAVQFWRDEDRRE